MASPRINASRRQFLGTTVSAAAASLAGSMLAGPAGNGLVRFASADEARTTQMKLSFMTFVCPTWKIEQIVPFAKEAGFDGVEIRVDAGHKHEVSSKSSADVRSQVKKFFADQGIAIASVATSVMLATPDAAAHKKHLEAGKANLDLAIALGAPVVRVFAGGGIPKLTPQAAEQVAASLDELGEHAKGSGACPMLECGHDIIKSATEAGMVLRQLRTPNVGALWNTSTMDETTFNTMKDRIRHFHVHDEILKPDNKNLVGLAQRMKGTGFRGFVSLEIIWNKDVPVDLLKETCSRLKGQIAEGLK